jgi:hypothetical protein
MLSPGYFDTIGKAIGAIAYAFANRSPNRSVGTFTRPDNVTPYIAGDIVGDVMTFDNVAPQVGTTLLTNVEMTSGLAMPLPTTTTPKPDGLLEAYLYLFSSMPTLPAVAPIDNQPFAPIQQDMSNRVATVYFATEIARRVGTFTLYEVVRNKNIWTSTDNRLYGVLVTARAWTPPATKGTFNVVLDFLPQPLVGL